MSEDHVSYAVLESFCKYCQDHPKERFWQALRNWADYDYVFVKNVGKTTLDTFYFKDRKNRR